VFDAVDIRNGGCDEVAFHDLDPDNALPTL